MEFTGERFIPGVHGNIELEHLHRYYLACEIADNKIILDIACGEGYGSALLAQKATHVTGVDISEQVISHANDQYKKDNLEFKVGSCINIPLQDASVDLVVSFETIEHLDQHELMLNEIKRVLKPDGLLLISSPDKNNYTFEREYINPFHVKELLDYEFKQLLEKYYKNLRLFGQRILYGSHILSEKSSTSNIAFSQKGDFFKTTNGIYKPMYWLALASDGQLPDLPSSIFEQPIDDSEIVQSWKILTNELNNQVNEQKNKVNEQKNKVNEQKNKIVELENEIVEIVTSKSWRWTRVFRQISRVSNKLKGVNE